MDVSDDDSAEDGEMRTKGSPAASPAKSASAASPKSLRSSPARSQGRGAPKVEGRMDVSDDDSVEDGDMPMSGNPAASPSKSATAASPKSLRSSTARSQGRGAPKV